MLLPDDNNVKLLYQSLQNMKRKYFNINVPNFATAGSEGNKAKDLKLHLYVNEKLELSLVDRDEDLPQDNAPKISDYYYFKTNNKFPGLRNHPDATIREIIENYETLRRKTNFTQQENNEGWSIDTETGIVTKRKKKEKKKWMVVGKKEIVDVHENILTQSKYEEMMQENMDTYIPRLLENIDTRNICDNMDTKSSYKILKNLCKFGKKHEKKVELLSQALKGGNGDMSEISEVYKGGSAEDFFASNSIGEFKNWVKTRERKEGEETIHVVSHGHTMSDYFMEQHKNKMTLENFQTDSFTTHENTTQEEKKNLALAPLKEDLITDPAIYKLYESIYENDFNEIKMLLPNIKDVVEKKGVYERGKDIGIYRQDNRR